MRFAGKVALITDGNSGIGLATTRQLVAEGARVAITGRDQAKLDAIAQELGGDVFPLQVDLGDPAAVESMASAVAEAFGGLDILFANAGISESTPLGKTSAEAFDAVLRSNLTSVFLIVQSVAPIFNEGGAIILNGSVMRSLGFPGSAAYAATKAGVSAMAKVFASELAPRGIRVNTVVPGATLAAVWTRGNRAGRALDAADLAFSPSIPVGHLNTADEAARSVLFLASDAAAVITAAEIVVDGGMTGASWGGQLYRPA